MINYESDQVLDDIVLVGGALDGFISKAGQHILAYQKGTLSGQGVRYYEYQRTDRRTADGKVVFAFLREMTPPELGADVDPVTEGE